MFKAHEQLEQMTLIESQNEEKARLLALGLAKMKRKAELNVEGFEEKET